MLGVDLQQHLGLGLTETLGLSRDLAQEIITKDICRQGVDELQRRFLLTFPDPDAVTVIPIMRGGCVVGDELSKVHGRPVSPMRMSYYAGNAKRLAEPICLQEPRIEDIVVLQDGKYLKTRSVAFAEAVIDSRGTIQGAMAQINRQIDQLSACIRGKIDYPRYLLYVLVSKTNGALVDGLEMIPAFQVHPDIWVYGMGCDNNEGGREEPRIMGLLSPYAKGLPQRPYSRKLF